MSATATGSAGSSRSSSGLFIAGSARRVHRAWSRRRRGSEPLCPWQSLRRSWRRRLSAAYVAQSSPTEHSPARTSPWSASTHASLAGGVRAGIAETEAELSHALATRDILIASINALTEQLEEVYQSNAARVLDAKTLDAIQAQYNSLRQSLLTRAQTVARLAQIGVQLRARRRRSPDPGRLLRSRAQGLHRGRDPCCTTSAASTTST